MKRTFVMTVIGPDRPGLVEAISRAIASRGGNWLQSRMAHLGGQFAGLLRVEVPTPSESALLADLQGLSASGLSVVIHEDSHRAAGSPASVCELDIVGQDRPGIINQISRVLALAGVNVEELETECSSAAMSGQTLFHGRARLGIPAHCELEALRAELEKIAADMIVEISLEGLSAGADAG